MLARAKRCNGEKRDSRRASSETKKLKYKHREGYQEGMGDHPEGDVAGLISERKRTQNNTGNGRAKKEQERKRTRGKRRLFRCEREAPPAETD